MFCVSSPTGVSVCALTETWGARSTDVLCQLTNGCVGWCADTSRAGLLAGDGLLGGRQRGVARTQCPLAGFDRVEQVDGDVGHLDHVLVRAGGLHPVVEHDVAERAGGGDA